MEGKWKRQHREHSGRAAGAILPLLSAVPVCRNMRQQNPNQSISADSY